MARMQTPPSDGTQEQRQLADYLESILAVLMIPVLLAGACLAIPLSFVVPWLRKHREHRFRMQMKSRGRLKPWPELVRELRETGGTCIEEKFSPKGPVRFWWTQEDVYRESPYEIIDWFTMRKGLKGVPFVHWCRERYTHAEMGSAVLVDTGLTPNREIYALWAECRSQAKSAQWVEVAPPEILPRRSEADSGPRS